MEVLAASGLVTADAGDCLLYTPRQPQWYRGIHGAWANDWMHFEGKEIKELAQLYGLAVNTPLSPADTSFWPRLLTEIRDECQQRETGYEEVVDALVRQLLVKLGRALHDPVAQFTPTEALHLPPLRALRQRLHEELAHPWTVGKMAAEVGLSVSRFAALYQKFFEISPVEDLLRARLQHAEYLLTNRAITVREAATRCGFRSLHYFSHVFHQRVGCAPSEYHRRGSR
jgi:AraC family transcriptional regulator of arabinose operon